MHFLNQLKQKNKALYFGAQIIFSLLVLGLLWFFSNQKTNTTQQPTNAQTQTTQTASKSATSSTANTQSTTTSNQQQYVSKLSDLKQTQNFLPNALAHIFEGEINRNKQAVGYHYEGFSHAKAKVIESTRSKTDKNNVYRAKITIDNIEKNAFSSFFPKDWSMQQVVDTINEAYNNRKLQSGNVYNGTTASGITVQMYLTENNKIISAFPLYNR